LTKLVKCGLKEKSWFSERSPAPKLAQVRWYSSYATLLGIRIIRTTTRPSTAKCDLDTYTLFLLAESKYPGCTRLAEILEGLSHDSVNRFLLRERYDPKDLFDEVKLQINLIDGTLSGDDTVIDKPYSDPNSTELVGYFWSGKHHRSVKGIQLITLYYTEVSGKSIPINYRIYNKREGKTKNDYLREMWTEVLDWGVQPYMVTTNARYSSQDNLKLLKDKKLGFLVGIAKNRLLAIDAGKYVQVKELEIPAQGLLVSCYAAWSYNVKLSNSAIISYVCQQKTIFLRSRENGSWKT